MEITCPNCGTKGEVNEATLPANTSSVRCPRCSVTIPFQSQQVAGNQAVCHLCKQPVANDEVVKFGNTLVCAGCKPTYVQMLEQGTAPFTGMRYGGFWIRFAAKIIDGIILGVVNMMVSFIFMALLLVGRDANASIAVTLLQLLVQTAIGVAYTTVFVGKYQATPGKMACGLKIVSEEGQRISYLRAFARYFGEMLSGLILGIGYIMIAFDDEKRALHDRICSTRVVYK